MGCVPSRESRNRAKGYRETGCNPIDLSLIQEDLDEILSQSHEQNSNPASVFADYGDKKLIKTLGQLLADDKSPEVINVWELMQGLEDEEHNNTFYCNSDYGKLRIRKTPLKLELQLIPAARSTKTSPEIESTTSTRGEICYSTDESGTGNDDSEKSLEEYGANYFDLRRRAKNWCSSSSEEEIAVSADSRDSNLVLARISVDSQESDTELVNSFEKILDQISVDEWYSIRMTNADIHAISKRAKQGYSYVPRIEACKRGSEIEEQHEHEHEHEGVTLYTSSSLQNLQEYLDCQTVKRILASYGVKFKEKDVSMFPRYQEELIGLTEIGTPVPRIFIDDRDLGGFEDILRIHHETRPVEEECHACGGCGGLCLVPCLDCIGDLRFIDDEGRVQYCNACNRSGVVRCPLCSSC